MIWYGYQRWGFLGWSLRDKNGIIRKRISKLNFKLPLSAPLSDHKSMQVGNFIYHAKIEEFDYNNPFDIKKPFILYRQMFDNGTLYPAEAYDLNASETESLGLCVITILWLPQN